MTFYRIQQLVVTAFSSEPNLLNFSSDVGANPMSLCNIWRQYSRKLRVKSESIEDGVREEDQEESPDREITLEVLYLALYLIFSS